MPSTVRVPTDFPTIAEAMGHVSSGDTIVLDPGYSNETATVTVDGLIISGTASSQNIHLLLGPSTHALDLDGDAPIAVDDNAAAGNAIVGNAGANVITVTGGADTLDGLTGNDRLVVDYSAATQSVTTLNLTSGTLDGTAGAFTDGLGGHSVAFDNIESFDVKTGSASDDIKTGSGDDVLNGGVGADTMAGGAGNDTYFVDNATDVVTETPMLATTRSSPR